MPKVTLESKPTIGTINLGDLPEGVMAEMIDTCVIEYKGHIIIGTNHQPISLNDGCKWGIDNSIVHNYQVRILAKHEVVSLRNY